MSGITVSDDFDRADGPLGSNWFTWNVNFVGHQPAIQSRKVFGWTDAPDNGGYWKACSFTNDQFSQIVVPGALASGTWLGVVVRVSADGGSLYNMIYFNNGGSYELRLYWKNAGSYNLLATFTLGAALSPGDLIRIVVIGPVLTGYVNGIQLVTASESTLNGGAPGFAFFNSTQGIDNWLGGYSADGGPAVLNAASISAPLRA
jgi:hypothetical protein